MNLMGGWFLLAKKSRPFDPFASERGEEVAVHKFSVPRVASKQEEKFEDNLGLG